MKSAIVLQKPERWPGGPLCEGVSGGCLVICVELEVEMFHQGGGAVGGGGGALYGLFVDDGCASSWLVGAILGRAFV